MWGLNTLTMMHVTRPLWLSDRSWRPFFPANMIHDKIAVIISQTGGGCRASNYIGFIRRALKKAGYAYIPVISINLSGLEENPGFKITPALVLRGIYSVVFGDIFHEMCVSVKTIRSCCGICECNA